MAALITNPKLKRDCAKTRRASPLRYVSEKSPHGEHLMQFEEKILINASAEKLFSLYASVSGWPSWDPDVKSSAIDEPFFFRGKRYAPAIKWPQSKNHFHRGSGQSLIFR
jgi:hypothetical protein